MGIYSGDFKGIKIGSFFVSNLPSKSNIKQQHKKEPAPVGSFLIYFHV